MNSVLRSTVAPLIYVAAAVMLFLSVKALRRVRGAAAARRCGAAGLLLAIAAGVLEAGAPEATVLVALLGGVAVGGVLGSRIPVGAPAPRWTWMAGAVGGCALALAVGALVGTDLDATRAGFAFAALVLGVGAVVVSAAVNLSHGPIARATARSAMAVALAGWSIALMGVCLGNVILLLGGGVVGTAALALARAVATTAGRSLLGMLVGPSVQDTHGYTNVRACGAAEAAMVLHDARTVALVPGFGMAAAGAQHPAKDVAELLEKRGARVVWAIHPSAGCVPGHMNIALDEANVPHDRVVDASSAEQAVREADAVLVVGANDVVNAASAGDRRSQLAGLMALDLSSARSVFVVKRSLRPGAAGVKNPLFEQANTMMVFGDAKRVLQGLLVELKSGGH